MKSFVRKILRFFASEDGPTAIEYAMMLMLVFLACLSAVTLLGQATNASFNASSNSIQKALDSGS